MLAGGCWDCLLERRSKFLNSLNCCCRLIDSETGMPLFVLLGLIVFAVLIVLLLLLLFVFMLIICWLLLLLSYLVSSQTDMIGFCWRFGFGKKVWSSPNVYWPRWLLGETMIGGGDEAVIIWANSHSASSSSFLNSWREKWATIPHPYASPSTLIEVRSRSLFRYVLREKNQKDIKTFNVMLEFKAGLDGLQEPVDCNYIRDVFGW